MSEGPRRTILVALDLSQRDPLALARAMEAAQARPARLLLYHVVTREEELGSEDPAAVMERTARALRERGFEVATHLVAGDPADAIVDAVVRTQPSRVVLAARSHDAGYEGWIGSVSRAVAAHAACPVDIVRPAARA
jgi:nucleotide-binding universal stress UspA family protein